MSLSQQPLPPHFRASEIPWAAEIVMTLYTDKTTPYTIVFPHCGGCHSEILLVKQLLLHGYDFHQIIFMDRDIRLIPDKFLGELEQALDCKVIAVKSYKSLLESLRKVDGRFMLLGFHALPNQIDITKTEGFSNFVEYILELVHAGLQPVFSTSRMFSIFHNTVTWLTCPSGKNSGIGSNMMKGIVSHL